MLLGCTPTILRSGVAKIVTIDSFVWNPSDAYQSSAVFSNGNKTVNEQNGNDVVSCRATTAIGQGIARIFITDPTTLELAYGLSLGSAALGGANGMQSSSGTYFYKASGNAFKNGARIGTSPVGPTFGVGDKVDVYLDGSTIYWYKNGNIAYSTSRVNGENGALYPTISAFGFTATFQDK